MKEKYHIEGMSCTACSSSVERVTRRLEGVISSNVNLINKTLYIEYDESLVNSNDILNVIKKAGFIPSIDINKEKKNINIDTKTYEDIAHGPSLKFRLISSLILILLLMFISIFEMLNKTIINNILLVSIIEMVLALIVIIINRTFYINGFKAIIHKSPNMDTLISLGSSISFLYGLYLIIMMIIDSKNSSLYFKNLYFDSSAMILFFITIGKSLEEKAKLKTKSLIDSLKELAPKEVTILKDNKEVKISIDEIKEGDLFIVKEGETIPLDGIIIKGEALIDNSSLTGEHELINKATGDEVLSLSINTNGYLVIKATSTSSSSTIAKMIDSLNEAGASKANIERLADKVSYYFVPFVLLLSLITFSIWLIISKDFGTSLTYAIQVLVISCPCALGLATPVAVSVSIGRCAKEGILIKDAKAFETLNNADIFVFDKTGTLTLGKPVIKNISTYNYNQDELIRLFKSIELKSSHPLKESLINYRNDISLIEIEDFKSHPGYGLEAKVNNEILLVGNKKFLENNNIKVNDSDLIGTLVYVSLNCNHIGTISLDDDIREESLDIVNYLKENKKEVALLSGDNYASTIKIRDELNIDTAYDSVLPLDKERIIKEVKESNKTVIYTGDGINDSLALNASNLGISISGAKGIAVDASSVILLKGNLCDFTKLIDISKNTVKVIKENLFWAFFYNILMIPIAAGVLSFIGIILNPIMCSISMSISSLIVVSNSLRLWRMKIWN